MNKRKYDNIFYRMDKVVNMRELVERTARRLPGQPAFLQKGKPGGDFVAITYSQFINDINGLGSKLTHMGLSGKKIAIIGENSYDWVVSYLAVVNGVGVVVPIDRELKAMEIFTLLNRAEVDCIIYSKSMGKVIEEVVGLMGKGDGESDCKVGQLQLVEMVSYLYDREEMFSARFHDDKLAKKCFCLNSLIDDGKRLLNDGYSEFVDADIDNDRMCALLFTSGTTGMTKAVMLSHRNIVENVCNMSQYVKIREGAVGLSVLPMHHTYEMTCHVMTGLYQGMTLAICEGLKYIQQNMVESKTNVMLAVPLVFESMHKKIMRKAYSAGKYEKLRTLIEISKRLKLYNKGDLAKRIFKEVHKATGGQIEQLIAGGAAIDPAVIEDFEAMGFPMMQGYGMTENAPIIAVNRDRYSKTASVGKPMPGTEVKIIDVDQDGMGEIICKGPSVMLGYFKDEEETQKVIKNQWLYTGDYGYLDDEGFLYITGRKKNVIVAKNGKNVFPEEIEYYMMKSEYVSEVFVHGVVDAKSGDVVIRAEIFPSYELIREEHGEVSDEEIHEILRREVDRVNDMMTSYKRIKRFGVRKSEFNKTTTRKIKRHNADNRGEA